MTIGGRAVGRYGGALAIAVLFTAIPAYRLTAVQCPDGTPPPCARAGPAGPGARSVAVLNFRLLSRDSTDAYLAEGLADAITARLSQVERLDVASRTAARLGRTPRAAFMVSGTMLRQNARLVVSVELLRASTGRNAWAQRYERSDTAVLDLERDIAVAVATAMLTGITPAERTALGGRATASPEAYDRLLRGNFLLARRSFDHVSRAIREYEEAARLDPSLAAAQARIGLACALWLDYSWDRAGRPAPDSVLAKGLAATSRALALDSASSDAWLSKAYIGMWAYPRTFEGVEDAFRHSLALDPRNAEAHHQYGDMLNIVQRAEESAVHMRAALAIDPARTITLRNLGSDLGAAAGLALLDSAIRLEPDHWMAWDVRALVRLQQGDTAGALADIATARRLAPPETEVIAAARSGIIYLRTGDTTRTRVELQQALDLLAPSGPLSHRAASVGSLLYMSGREEEAITLMERIRPRGAILWFDIMDKGTDTSELPERVRRVLDDARPPWVSR